MDSDRIWKSLFYRRLKGQPEPLFLFPEQMVSAAALWMGIRLWMQRWKQGGPLVFCATGSGPEYLEVLLATMMRDGTFIAGHPEKGSEQILQEVLQWQPDYVVLNRKSAMDIPGYRECSEVNEHRNAILLGRIHGYDDILEGHPLRKLPNGSRRLILSTSGTSGGASKWAVLSDRNLLSVLRTHIPRLNMRNATVHSVLPWNHAFGLILDLLPATLVARTVIRDEPGDARRFATLQDRFSINYVSAVPALFERWIQDSTLQPLLSEFRGGLIGGAPIGDSLSETLRGTAFRVGYGQTEASPGITLGKPGEFRSGFIGYPLGCEVQIQDGTLRYRGANVCTATVSSDFSGSNFGSSRALMEDSLHLLDEALLLRESGQWQDTGDIVEGCENGFLYLGRADHNFKLSNGRFLDAVRWEHSLERSTGLPCYILPDRGGMELSLVVDGPGQSRDPARNENNAFYKGMENLIRKQLGGLQEYIRNIRFLHRDELPLNGKGLVIRAKLAETKTEKSLGAESHV